MHGPMRPWISAAERRPAPDEPCEVMVGDRAGAYALPFPVACTKAAGWYNVRWGDPLVVRVELWRAWEGPLQARGQRRRPR